jgi:predicted TIM-barrel fold metal-dependent hydrolase
MFMKNGGQCIDLVTSGVLERYPTLNFVSVESGAGWVPFALDTADYTWLGATQGHRSNRKGDLLPSDLFRRQVYVTMWFEPTAPLRLRGEIPLDHIMFETDFPHTACLYRDLAEVISNGIGQAPVEVQRKILWDNASALYHIEPPNETDLLGSVAA